MTPPNAFAWIYGARPTRMSAMLLATVLLALAAGSANADALTEGAKNYKPFAVEHIGKALTGAKELQAAVKSGDVETAQTAWIKSRKAWEAVEPITGEFFGKLDGLIDAWPDAKQGYHAVEAPLFAGKLTDIGQPVDGLVANLAKFKQEVSADSFTFTPQGLLSGATKLAYEVGENKSKGGESPFAGTSLVDMNENIEGIEAVYKLVFEEPLKAKDAKLATRVNDKIESIEGLVKVKSLKQLNASALNRESEELAVLLQSAAPKLGLKAPDLGG